MNTISEHIDRLRQSLKADKHFWMPIAILGSEAMVLVLALSLLGVQKELVFWFVALAILTAFVFSFSNYFLRQSFAPFTISEAEIADFRKKEAENRARFFNAALAAIVTWAVGIYGLNYSKNTASFDWKTIEAITIESQFPSFDSRITDLLTQYQILGPNPMTDIFPLYFPSTLRDGNEDIGIMNKVNAFTDAGGFSPAISAYTAFLQSAETYVALARELERASDNSQPTYSPAEQKRLKGELLPVQNLLRKRFFSFQHDYCAFVGSAVWTRVVDKVKAIRGTDFSFRSQFCVRMRAD
ncbi:hypothetical protein RA307_07450 [Xanthobacteraceae bacterium Astr-EGSB]|uniref:hypothetical protein n=1 Tax=Astrobacterium formosum TaxID=3069710 RepID=UPI0027AF41BA|nr:hypothetical protein [Xanthobacteraceae bacterium Astr-EGSB]